MDYNEIGRRVRKYRKARGLSQEALAEKINISTVHMSHIETGNTKMSLSVFADLAVALEVPADDLLYNVEDRSPSAGELGRLLGSCTPQQARIIEDILRAAKASLDTHLSS